MLETLRDPIWNSISAMVAIIALIITINHDKSNLPDIKKIITAIGKIFIATVIFFMGPPLEYFVFYIFQGGMPMAMVAWQNSMSPELISSNLWRNLFFALFISSISVLTISKQNPKNSILRTIVATIIAMWVADIFLFIFDIRGSVSLFFSLFSDILGGFIGGATTFWAVRIYDNLFES